MEKRLVEMNNKFLMVKNIKIVNIILQLFSSLIILFLVNLIDHDFSTIAVTSLIAYATFFISWFIHNENKLNFYTLFLLFTLIFYFGQFILFFLGVPMESGRTIVDGLLPYDNIINTGKFIILFMVILHIGVLFSTMNINKYNVFMNKLDRGENFNNQTKYFKLVAYLLFLISIIPSFIILIGNIRITLTAGYGAIFSSDLYQSGGFDSILRFIAQFTIPSFLMLIILLKGNKSIKILYLILGSYLLLYFVSGSRLSGVLVLSTILLIIHYWYRPINTKAAFKLGVMAFLILAILSSISEVRNSLYISNDSINLFTETFKNVIVSNPIFLAMEEGGYTFLATATVLTYSPSQVAHYYGMSYINSIAMLVPNLFWDVHPAAGINTDITFKHFLTNYGGIGSSFIAEAYWNFGKYALFLAVIFGILIGLLTNLMAKFSAQKNIVKFYLIIYIAQFTLFYVRSDTVNFWRNFIYFGVIPIVISYLLSELFGKKGKKWIKNH